MTKLATKIDFGVKRGKNLAALAPPGGTAAMRAMPPSLETQNARRFLKEAQLDAEVSTFMQQQFPPDPPPPALVAVVTDVLSDGPPDPHEEISWDARAAREENARLIQELTAARAALAIVTETDNDAVREAQDKSVHLAKELREARADAGRQADAARQAKAWAEDCEARIREQQVEPQTVAPAPTRTRRPRPSSGYGPGAPARLRRRPPGSEIEYMNVGLTRDQRIALEVLAAADVMAGSGVLGRLIEAETRRREQAGKAESAKAIKSDQTSKIARAVAAAIEAMDES